MLNQVQLQGRLTRDPETRYTTGANNIGITTFTIAVDRNRKREGDPDADFIKCKCFGKGGEFISKWFHKGDMILVNGHIQTGSYKNQNGETVYTTEIIVEQSYFGGSKNTSQTSQNRQERVQNDRTQDFTSTQETSPYDAYNGSQSHIDDGFLPMDDNIGDADLPF